MRLNEDEKNHITDNIIKSLSDIKTITRLIVFGSFFERDEPNDLDLAVIDEDQSDYLTLALSYRRKLRSISSILPLDVLPIYANQDISGTYLEKEIGKGKVIYEK